MMRLAEVKYFRSDEAEVADERGIDSDLGAFHAKLKGGGDLFHRLGAIFAFASVGSKKCHARIIEQLQLNNSGISGELGSYSILCSLLHDVTYSPSYTCLHPIASFHLTVSREVFFTGVFRDCL
jgi:hypothetical protein